ncbi:MAG: formate--tetrahydrofolate ligase, partial [Pseudomonadota bacterium]
MLSDIEIAQATKLQAITAVADRLNLKPEDLILYGQHIAKLSPACIQNLQQQASDDGKEL